MTYIIDSQYFPTHALFSGLSRSTNCIIEQYVPYRKLSFLNRCTLPGANGLIHLSVPLQNGRDQKTIIKEVKIANQESWQARHWKTITACYNRSPWFEYFRDGISRLYQRKCEYLVDWNMECLRWTTDVLLMDIQLSLTDDYREQYPGDKYTDWRGRSLPVKSNSLFLDPYRQVFEERLGFIPNLSVLDRIFCEGKGLAEMNTGRQHWRAKIIYARSGAFF